MSLDKFLNHSKIFFFNCRKNQKRFSNFSNHRSARKTTPISPRSQNRRSKTVPSAWSRRTDRGSFRRLEVRLFFSFWNCFTKLFQFFFFWQSFFKNEVLPFVTVLWAWLPKKEKGSLWVPGRKKRCEMGRLVFLKNEIYKYYQNWHLI